MSQHDLAVDIAASAASTMAQRPQQNPLSAQGSSCQETQRKGKQTCAESGTATREVEVYLHGFELLPRKRS